MATRGEGDTRFLPLFGALCLAVGLLFLLGGAVDGVRRARFVAKARPAIAEVVLSLEYRTSRGSNLCCTTTAVVVDADGTRLTGGWRDPVRYISGGLVNVLYFQGWSYRPVQMLPDDDWVVWGGMRMGLRTGGTFTGLGVATLLIGSLLRRRSRASV